jgi:ribonuclease Z
MSGQRFELLILGSGAASPTAKRNPSAQLLNIAERHFLIDCGEATQMQLRKYKAKIQKINHIFITHMHGDHFFGLPGLISTMQLLDRKNPLHIYGPRELRPVIEVILDAAESKLSYELIWHPTKNDAKHLVFEDDKVEVHSFPLRHRIYCTGFLFKEKPLPRKIAVEKLKKFKVSVAEIHKLKKGLDAKNDAGLAVKNSKLTTDPAPPRSFAYASDTVADKALSKYIGKVDLLYHEATFLSDNTRRAKKTGHSTAKQAGAIAKRAGAAKLIIGHFSARYDNTERFLNEAKSAFSNTEVADEGTVFKL